jgi:transcription antitermination factor NusA-like protein
MGDKKAVTLICRDEKLPLLIGKKGSNVRIISQLLDANVEVLTIEEANDIDLKYDKVDYKAMGQSTYARALNKFRPSMEQFNSYNDNAKTYQKSVSEETKVVHTPKKETKNYGQSFKEMNTNDLFKDMD